MSDKTITILRGVGWKWCKLVRTDGKHTENLLPKSSWQWLFLTEVGTMHLICHLTAAYGFMHWNT